jgi:CHAT domain-containing protein
VNIKEVRDHVTKLRNLMWPPEDALIATDESRGNVESEIDSSAEFLSEILLRPIKQYLENKKNLVFIPSGELAHVPWGMLPPKDPLIHTHTVTVIPSLSIWHRLYSRSENVQQLQDEPTISVVSNSPRRRKGELRDIPFSRIEALHIARLHDQVPILADRESVATFENHARSTQILHLCAHSNFNYESPMRSKIYLFKGSLTLKKLNDLNLGAELVVFSSCLSGLSRVLNSGGAFSFAHTLLGSGARAFMGTLWPVDDSATLVLMMLFYEKLRTGASPAESLRQAQEKMRNFTRDDLVRVTDRLFDLDHDDFGNRNGESTQKYVINLRYWLQDCLLAKDYLQFREPRCWAAFVLTGYGDRPIYKDVDLDITQRKRKRAEDLD